MIYFIRQLAQPAVRAGIFAAAILAVFSLVSVPNVIANTAGVESVSGLMVFFLSAFVETEFFVQVAVLIAGAIAAWAAVDTIKNIVSQENTQTA